MSDKQSSVEDLVADALEEVAKGLHGLYAQGQTVRALVEAAAKVRAGHFSKKRRGKS